MIAQRGQFLEEDPEDAALEEAFLEFGEFAAAPCDDIREVSAGKKAARERVLRKRNEYMLVTATRALGVSLLLMLFLVSLMRSTRSSRRSESTRNVYSSIYVITASRRRCTTESVAS